MDLFNHRTLGLFYRAWAKYRLPIRFEEASKPLSDPFSRALAALIGLGLDASQGDLMADGGELLSVSGLLSRRVQTPATLQQSLSHLFGLNVVVQELQGRWVAISETERTRLGSGQYGFATLGQTAVLGGHVWDIQSRFRLRIGPVDFKVFNRFFEPEDLRAQLWRSVRLAIGGDLDFDVQLVLKREDAPAARLGGKQHPTSLGRTSWMISKTPERDLDDAILSHA